MICSLKFNGEPTRAEKRGHRQTLIGEGKSPRAPPTSSITHPWTAQRRPYWVCAYRFRPVLIGQCTRPNVMACCGTSDRPETSSICLHEANGCFKLPLASRHYLVWRQPLQRLVNHLSVSSMPLSVCLFVSVCYCLSLLLIQRPCVYIYPSSFLLWYPIITR